MIILESYTLYGGFFSLINDNDTLFLLLMPSYITHFSLFFLAISLLGEKNSTRNPDYIIEGLKEVIVVHNGSVQSIYP